MKSKSPNKTATRISHPAEESATADLAFLGAELTRLQADKIHLATTRDRVVDQVGELAKLYADGIQKSNQVFLRIDLNRALLDTKIRNITRLIRNALPRDYEEATCGDAPMTARN